MDTGFLKLNNAGSAPMTSLPCPPFAEFRRMLTDAVRTRGWHVASFFAMPEEKNGARLIAVLTDDASACIRLLSSHVSGSYAALTPECAQFHWFEREIFEQTGIIPEGHPWLKPIRFTAPEAKPGVTDYFRLHGSAAHEVAVGPVHAGVIEPGHFRFQCMGEDVYTLEISLGYQHRGIEKMLRGGPDKKTLHVMETVAGDTSTASAGAYCRILEALDPESRVSARSEAIRAIAWELERIANHIGDLGALAGDVAYLPTASYCGRIRGEFLNMTATICGNRFGRGLIVPGGVGFDIEMGRVLKIRDWMDRVTPELENALAIMFDSPSVLDRLENTGVVSAETAREIGLVGVAARASGIRRDVRMNLPYGWYRTAAPVACCVGSGDVFARAEIRRRELTASLRFVRNLIENLPTEEGTRPVRKRLPDTIAVSLSEAWRGALCHTAVTAHDGSFAAYKIVDPSFHNWFGLAMALRGEQISNFPICNKSFNLSYCGHDL